MRSDGFCERCCEGRMRGVRASPTHRSVSTKYPPSTCGCSFSVSMSAAVAADSQGSAVGEGGGKAGLRGSARVGSMVDMLLLLVSLYSSGFV